MFQEYIKNYQTRRNANIWQQALRQREIEKNNYRALGNIKKAKEFVAMVSQYESRATFQTNEQVIFASDSLTEPIRATYAFVTG